ncbi:MAG: alpha-ketoacid dehydrogenase subunit beta [Elusimicrobia bacterium]|nr:alpha-ketoacid dehydrogenase subunit beta [Elusimicrobiota bacterium]
MAEARRELKYWEAISEATVQAMEADESVFVFGIGVDDPKKIFGTTKAAYERFGAARVFDTPVSENALTGVAIGASLTGSRPVMIHARNDFMYYCMDQLFNHAAKWYDMLGGLMRAPIVVRAIVGRGWGQGSQHSQSLQALFAHVPGLNVALPSSPYDAKGLFLAAIRGDAPTILIENRKLYEVSGPVPKEPYALPVGKGAVLKKGKDATIVAFSQAVQDALEAAAVLKGAGIDAEVVDPRWAKPLDKDLILSSVKKTGRLLVMDTSWKSYGVSAEVAALAAEHAFSDLKAPVARIALPDMPAPTTQALEKVFYPTVGDVVHAVEKLFGRKRKGATRLRPAAKETFTGPF